MMISFIGVLMMIYFSSNAAEISDFKQDYIFALVLCILSSVLISLINVIMRMLRGVHYSLSAGF